MTEVVKFSSVCGQNIRLSNSCSTATWNLTNSGGHIFSKNSISPGQTVRAVFEGSGHCSVGYTTTDPSINGPNIESVDLKTSKFHKQDTYIQISVHENAREGTLSWLGENGGVIKERFKLQHKKQIWLALNVRFGKAAVTLLLIDSPERFAEFSYNHGANVKLEDNNTHAESITWSPASTCFLKTASRVGEVLVLSCSPLLENGRAPSRYYLKLQVFDKDPSCLKGECKYLFDASEVPVEQTPITTLDLLLKEDCNGTVSISMISPSIIGYRTASGKYNEKHIPVSASSGLWIILEPFRISVSARQRHVLPEEANLDVVDGVIAEPLNEYAQNTMMSQFSIDENTGVKRPVNVVEYARVCNSQCKETNESRTKTTNTFEGRIQALERGQNEIREGVHFIKSALQSGQQSTMNTGIAETSGERRINVRKHWSSLIRDLDCMPLLDKLFERHVITQIDYDGIQQLGVSTDKNRQLLRLLSQKYINKTAMDELLDSVEQGHLKERF